jgi:branched-subunit amino acid aminotransferase/4-amino-4-deoxychorismate lyase
MMVRPNALPEFDPAADRVQSHGLALIFGKIMPLPSASVPLVDKGFLFGSGLFETICIQQGVPIALPLHVCRMRGAADVLHWTGMDWEAMSRDIWRLSGACESRADEVRSEGVPKATRWALKVILTEGLGCSFEELQLEASLQCYMYAVPVYAIHNGDLSVATLLNLWPVTDGRAPVLVNMKATGPYMANRRAFLEAKANHCQDALFISPGGNVVESASAAFVWIDHQGQMFVSDPAADGFLESVTVARLQRHFATLGKSLRPFSLPTSRLSELVAGAALVSSIKGARPVGAVGQTVFGGAASIELAQALNAALDADVRQWIAMSGDGN